MVDRFLAWLGAGAVLVGVSAGMLAGAGVAVAEEGADAGDGGAKTSETSKPAENNEDSPKASTDTDADTGTDADAENDAEDDQETFDDEETVVEAKGKNDNDTTRTNRSVRVTSLDKHDTDTDKDDDIRAAALTATVEKTDADDPPQTASTQRTAVTPTVKKQDVVDDEDTVETAAVAFAAAADEETPAAATAAPLQGLLSVVGTIVFNLYGLATSILGGPPILPPGSTVTVRSSSLHLDCGCDDGDGVDVPADWYVPETEEGEAPPDQLIYLQHGFLARGPWYSHTAAALAEQTHSIVVAPSITSNFLASDACWLGGNAMHESMARLFDDGNTALATSAATAGYTGAIPDRVLLIGHSLGGGAVLGIAGAMAGKPAEQRLAGVIMLDGVPFDPEAAEKIAAVDADIPIYNLAAPRYFWNQFGVGTDVLEAARPGEFIGVTLVNGSHVDSMRGGNPLIQFGQELVAGFVRPENGDAAQILMIDWANDMFAGIVHDPITEEFTIDTPSGVATAVPLPNDLTKPFILNPLNQFIASGNSFFVIEPSCVKESIGTCSATQAA